MSNEKRERTLVLSSGHGVVPFLGKRLQQIVVE
jgi:hypothetical protein